MAGGVIASLPKPKRIHFILSKVMGGTMVFWVLWRLKHDWHELVVSFLHLIFFSLLAQMELNFWLSSSVKQCRKPFSGALRCVPVFEYVPWLACMIGLMIMIIDILFVHRVISMFLRWKMLRKRSKRIIPIINKNPSAAVFIWLTLNGGFLRYLTVRWRKWRQKLQTLQINSYIVMKWW